VLMSRSLTWRAIPFLTQDLGENANAGQGGNRNLGCAESEAALPTHDDPTDISKHGTTLHRGIFRPVN
jgi:hypothetical protein